MTRQLVTVNPPGPLLVDRKVLEHAREILSMPHSFTFSTGSGMSQLESQQYRFYTTANLLLLTFVTSLLGELPPKEGA